MKQEKKYKLLIVSPYPVGVAPSQRLKYEQYFDAFTEAGYDITVKPFVSRNLWKIIYQKGHFITKIFQTCLGYLRRMWLILSLPRYDIVYIHLWVTPFFTTFYEWVYCKLGKKIIYDIDDLVFLRENKSKSNKTAGIFKSRKKPIYLIKHADHVITCTPYLDEFVKQYNKRTTDISSTVDTDRYVPVNNYKNDHEIILGWSGSITSSRYFFELEEVLKEISKMHKIKVVVMGNPNIHFDGVNMECMPWSEEIELSTLQKFDIGLYPMPNEEFALGKSGLKAIQYMALGIPTVATAMGANFRVVDHEINGFLVNNHKEWINALNALITSPELRERMGKKGREKIEKEFSIKANKQIYLNVLHKVIDKD